MTALPFEPPLEPMLSAIGKEIPAGDGWTYEPKWDGFRAIVYFDGENDPYIQSRDLKPLGRYFPELVAGLRDALPGPVILDGEVVRMTPEGLDFGSLQLRVHPAESRIRKLAAEIPASFVAFDLLAQGDEDLRGQPFEVRHARLLRIVADAHAPLFGTPATSDIETARDWFDRFEGAGFDGVVAKRLNDIYRPGVRAMVKIKHIRSADCVVAGYRWNKGQEGESVGSLLLGLYDEAGVLHHVGHTSSFTAVAKRELVSLLAPYVTADEDAGFGRGRTPGAPSRWTSGQERTWVRLRPELVCEVGFDHLQGDHFRHATTFRRWRTDKLPEQCTYDQLTAAVPTELSAVFDAG